MKEYNSIPRFWDDGTLKGEQIVAFNKLDGQNFRVKFSPKGANKNQFTAFGSRRTLVDEKTEGFGDAVKFFNKNYENVLKNIITNNSRKKGVFKGVDEITFFFEWYGNKSFAGFHKEGDEMHLALIDVFLKKKGYIEPNTFIDIFCDDARIETPSVIYIGKLDMNFANSIVSNDWTKEDCQYPEVKEGVVCKRSTLMKGQKLPMCKIKTNWWLTELHNNFSEEECKLLE
jgi:hypothetical protein